MVLLASAVIVSWTVVGWLSIAEYKLALVRQSRRDNCM